MTVPSDPAPTLILGGLITMDTFGSVEVVAVGVTVGVLVPGTAV